MRLMMRVIAFAAVSLFCIGPGLILADTYPTKPVRMVVPYPPGGATDIIGRVLAQKLSDKLGQQVVVDNRPGAAGNIGAQQVAQAPGDGYTLLMGALTSHSISASLHRSVLAYDLAKDFAPISIVGTVPLVLVVNPSVPANSLPQLIALAKAKPGKLAFASAGNGSPQHLAGEMFKLLAGVDIFHVPYKGSGPAMTDLVGGQVPMMFETAPAALPQVQGGKLRPLVVATEQRISMLPDVATAAEAGLRGFEVSSMFGLLAPANTPKPIIARLNSELAAILQLPEVKEKFQQQGVDATHTTPEQAAQRIREEVAKWAKVISEANVKAE
jgi:tripartite-type tricarboxylate transporter receptor subunit TctC